MAFLRDLLPVLPFVGSSEFVGFGQPVSDVWLAVIADEPVLVAELVAETG